MLPLPSRQAAAAPPAGVRRPPDDHADRDFVVALARGLDVLGAFRARDALLGNQELARRTGLPKSTVSRLTYTLTRLGYLEAAQDREGASGYRLGSAVLALGSTLLQHLDIRALARGPMQELAERTGSMVALGMPDRLSMIYVETCRGGDPLGRRLHVGSRLPMVSTAMGKACLAASALEERESVLRQLAGRDPGGAARARECVAEALREYAALGCCTSLGEWQPGIHAIAVPVRPPGRPVMAINCGGPAWRFPPQALLQEVRPQLLALAARLQAE